MATPPPAGVPPLEVRGARRAFGADRGLDGVDLRLERGEIYGLLGPNGAGKTSLVRALCGRLRLDAGSVRVFGRDAQDAEARRGLGLVPQQIALYPELTVAENLELLGRLAGLPAGEAGPAVKDALGWIGLADRAASLVATLSGGQQRRVNLAAATLHRPAVLLLDEPTVGCRPRRPRADPRAAPRPARAGHCHPARYPRHGPGSGAVLPHRHPRRRAHPRRRDPRRPGASGIRGRARAARLPRLFPSDDTRRALAAKASPPGRTSARGRVPSRWAWTRFPRSPGD